MRKMKKLTTWLIFTGISSGANTDKRANRSRDSPLDSTPGTVATLEIIKTNYKGPTFNLSSLTGLDNIFVRSDLVSSRSVSLNFKNDIPRARITYSYKAFRGLIRGT